jgi:AcrR family transcriptional regulator
MAMAGLRERNRRRVRRELADAALRLFSVHGVAGTTADDIAELAGTSRSTFFRQFTTKEHVLFPDHEEELAVYRRLLSSRAPAQDKRDGILQAARDASHATLEAYRRDPEGYRERHRVIASSPTARELSLRLDRDWEAALAEAFAHHLGEQPGASWRADLLAGSLMGAVGAFHRSWADRNFEEDPSVGLARVMAVFELGVGAVLGPDTVGQGIDSTGTAGGEPGR